MPARSATPAPPPAPKYLRRGKVKEVYEVSPTELEFRFTDDISVFDKHIPSEIPHKGETLNLTASHWFEMCSRLKIPHHFLGRSSPTSMRVKRVQVVPKPRTLGAHPKNFLVPLEFIVRYYVAGSLWDRAPVREDDRRIARVPRGPHGPVRRAAPGADVRGDDEARADRPAAHHDRGARALGARREADERREGDDPQDRRRDGGGDPAARAPPRRRQEGVRGSTRTAASWSSTRSAPPTRTGSGTRTPTTGAARSSSRRSSSGSTTGAPATTTSS